MTDSPAPRDRIAAIVAEALGGDIYACGRVWEAWQWGAMSQGDFELAAEIPDVIDNIVDPLLRAFPVLAAEPTTTADALKRSREAIQEVLDSPLVPSGGNSIRAAQVALVLNERGLLAALAPEPAESGNPSDELFVKLMAEGNSDATILAMVLAEARHEGYSDDEIWAAEHPDHTDCDRVDNPPWCEPDEYGNSAHPVTDRLGELGEIANTMLEAVVPAVSPDEPKEVN